MSQSTVYLLITVALWTLSIALNFFTCLHYGSFYAFLLVPIQIFAWYLPATCYNYNAEDTSYIHLNMGVGMREASFARCRELGWVAAVFLAGICYMIPCLVWIYGRSLDWLGVVLIFWATTCWWWGLVTFIKYSKLG